MTACPSMHGPSNTAQLWARQSRYFAYGQALQPFSSPPCRAAGTYLLHNACGIISPNARTAVTDMMIAASGCTSRSSSTGSASIAPALHSSSVTSSKCWLAMTGMMRAAYFRSLGVPAEQQTDWSCCLFGLQQDRRIKDKLNCRAIKVVIRARDHS